MTRYMEKRAVLALALGIAGMAILIVWVQAHRHIHLGGWHEPVRYM